MVETSVVIAVRNGERFLRDAMQSVLAQLCESDELIVVDDGSTDRSAAIAASLQDPRVQLIRLKGGGVSAARNRGWAAARGQFLAFLDHDDLWPPGRHSMLIEALRQNPLAGAAYGRTRVIEEADTPRPGAWNHFDGQHLVTNMSSALYRAERLRACERFCESLTLGEDSELQLRLIEAGLDPVRCDGESWIYRRHGHNATNDAAGVKRSMLAIARLRGRAAREAAASASRAVSE
jgi:glycosyltransferase involved in cell wall biosynthesis